MRCCFDLAILRLNKPNHCLLCRFVGMAYWAALFFRRRPLPGESKLAKVPTRLRAAPLPRQAGQAGRGLAHARAGGMVLRSTVFLLVAHKALAAGKAAKKSARSSAGSHCARTPPARRRPQRSHLPPQRPPPLPLPPPPPPPPLLLLLLPTPPTLPPNRFLVMEHGGLHMGRQTPEA